MSFSLSVVTFCKGRIVEARESLPLYLSALRQGDELVLVDYGDEDGVAAFAASLNDPRVTVVQFSPAKWFWINHARNIGCRAAAGDILLLSDIDFSLHPALIEEARAVGPGEFLIQASQTGAMGNLVVRWDDWKGVGGYEEAFTGYGEDDMLMRRLLQVSGLRMRIQGERVSPTKTQTQIRVHAEGNRGLTNSVNQRIGKYLRMLHPFKSNISRNWAFGGKVILESELRKSANQARSELPQFWE